MPSDLKKMIEGAMPGWTTQTGSPSKRDGAGANWTSEPDQTGVDFDELKRKYLPKSPEPSYSADASRGRDMTSPKPTSGTVTFQKVRPKTDVDSAFGSKTVVVDRDGRGIVGKQG